VYAIDVYFEHAKAEPFSENYGFMEMKNLMCQSYASKQFQQERNKGDKKIRDWFR